MTVLILDPAEFQQSKDRPYNFKFGMLRFCREVDVRTDPFAISLIVHDISVCPEWTVNPAKNLLSICLWSD